MKADSTKCQLTAQETSALRQFFGELERTLGLRSSIGSQLEHLRLGVKISCFSSLTEDALIRALDNQVQSGAESSSTASRMARTHRAYWPVLDALVTDRLQIASGVSVSLACQTQLAQDGYEKAKQVLAKKGMRLDANPREWILWVLETSSRSACKKQLLADIAKEASALAAVAIEAFRRGPSVSEKGAA